MEPSLLLRVMKGTATFLSGKLILTFVQFLTSIVVIRSLEVEDYGKLALLLSIYAIGSIFLDFGLGTVVATNIARARGEELLDEVKKFLIRYFQLVASLGGACFVIFSLSSFWIGKGSLSLAPLLLFFVGCYLFLTGFKRLFDITFYGYTYYQYQVCLQVVESFSRLCLATLLLVILNKGLREAVLVYPISTLIAIFVMFPFWLKIILPLKFIKVSQKPVFREALKSEGKWVILAMPLAQIQAQLPLWVIKFLLGIKAVGIYSAAQRVYTFPLSLLTSTERAIFPIISEKIVVSQEKIQEMLQKSTKYLFWASSIVIIGSWIIAPAFFRIAFSLKYLDSVLVFRFFLFHLLVYTFLFTQKPLLYALKAQKYLFYRCLIDNFTTFAFLWLFVSLFGVVGAAIAKISCGAILVWWHFYTIRIIMPNFRIDFFNIFQFDDSDRKTFATFLRRLRRKAKKEKRERL